MSTKRRVEQLEKTLTDLIGNPGERGMVFIIRSWLHGEDAVLTGYRHHTGTIWPLDRTQWPHVPAGTRVGLTEVWSDHDTYPQAYSPTEHREQAEVSVKA